MAESDIKIILASRSAARRRMLEAAGVEFECVAADLDEESITKKLLAQGTAIEKIAPALAQEKALHVARAHPAAFVIGADQTLDFENGMLSKAGSPTDAKDKLKRLRGKTHLSGFRCLCCAWR